ncbi:MAG: L-threonylcarbamoyladenylate synthase [archaeon]
MDPIDLTDNIIEGNVFIYPTDTIYGLGCDATNRDSVARLKAIKGRDADKPLSVIAPYIGWIFEHFDIEKKDIGYLNKYFPGPYTLLLKKRKIDFMDWISPNDRMGVRIPRFAVGDKYILDSIGDSQVPIVTTSVNLSGEKPAVRISEVSEDILKKVDFFIKAKNERKLSGRPSTLVIDGEEIGRK